METEGKKYKLVLITSGFPFGNGETFLEKEIVFLNGFFKQIYIVAQGRSFDNPRKITGNIIVLPYQTKTSFRSLISALLEILRNFSFLTGLLKDEIQFRNKFINKFNVQAIALLFKRIIKAIQLRQFIEKEIIASDPAKIIFYSYWLNTGVHSISMLRNSDYVKIARAHGSDLYEDKSPNRFLPLHNYSLKRLDHIFTISSDGKEYLKSKYPDLTTKISVARLGVSVEESVSLHKTDDSVFTIISCSNIIKLKRIDLIIESLSLIETHKKIRWIHFGAGSSFPEISDLAIKRLEGKTNITYLFKGQVENREIVEFYSQNYIDLFINTSLTEGIPVSIMEAMSYGIPALATDVGGVSELVTQETGILIPVVSSPQHIALCIEEYIKKPSSEIINLRLACYNFCKNNFSADTNYTQYLNALNSILASKK